MMGRAIPVAITIGVLGLGAGTAQGAARTGVQNADGPGPEIRVINNYTSPVRVYVQDTRGKLHALGTVLHADVEVLTVPESVTTQGDFRVKVFPAEPLWALASYGEGVRTGDLHLGQGEVLNFWVEPDLTQSTIQVTRS